jgi:hypothetical protein
LGKTVAMNNKWILDVLTDLKAFAHLNGLPGLAVELDRTARVAEAEIAAGRAQGTVASIRETMESGGLSRAG